MKEYQLLIIRQGRTVTGMFRSAPAGVVVKETGLRPAISLLNNRQRRYTQRLLCLPINNEIREILPETFRRGDAHAQPQEIESTDWKWLNDKKVRKLGQRLANSLTNGTDLDTSYGIENTEYISPAEFQGQMLVPKNAEIAKEDALKHLDSENEMSFWTDGSKLDSQRTGAGIAWKQRIDQWGYRKAYLGKDKEVFDAELYAVDQALDTLFGEGNHGQE